MSEIIFFYSDHKVGKWTIKTHSRHGPSPHQKHVHIICKGLKGKYSWNVDGTRHDTHRFPVSEQQIDRARELAAKALRVPAHTLQFLTTIDGGCRVSFVVENETSKPRYVASAYIRVNKRLIILGVENGLLAVISF